MAKHTALVVLWVLLCSNLLSADEPAKPDPRLDPKITIDCVNTRLYSALDKISAETKVTVRAGKNMNDWQTRDMPVLVCARDIPLGKLLQGIADATHLLLSESAVNKVSTYRIYRDVRREKEIADFDKVRKDAARAAASNDWDALSKAKDVPKDIFDTRLAPSLARDDVTRMSNLISRLSPEVKARVLDGEPYVLGLSECPAALLPYMTAFAQSLYESQVNYAGEHGEPAPKPFDELAKTCYLKIQFGRILGYPDQLCPTVNMHGVYQEIMPNYYQGVVQKAFPEIPARPVVPDPKLRRDDIDPRYKKLSLGKVGPPFLDTKLKLEPPKDGPKPRYSDLLCAVSKATGYSIVAEGNAARYVGIVMDIDEDLDGMLSGKEITVRDALDIGTELNREVWYIDEPNKLIIGRDAEWIETVKSLVPEKLLKETSAKLNGQGMDLDDLAPFADLTKEQVRAWLRHCPEYPEIQEQSYQFTSVSANSTLWRLYFALDPSDRATARSGKPVTLGSLDSAWRCSVMRRYLVEYAERRYENPEIPYPPRSLDLAAFDSPDSAPALMLWIEGKELPQVKGKDYYVLKVKTEKDGAVQEMGESLYGLFPIFAPGKDPVLEKLKKEQQSPTASH